MESLVCGEKEDKGRRPIALILLALLFFVNAHPASAGYFGRVETSGGNLAFGLYDLLVADQGRVIAIQGSTASVYVWDGNRHWTGRSAGVHIMIWQSVVLHDGRLYVANTQNNGRYLAEVSPETGFIQYSPEWPKGSWIYSVYLHNGFVWAAGHWGAARYDPVARTWMNTPNLNNANYVAITVGGDGKVWTASTSSNDGTWYYAGGSWTRVPWINSNSVYKLLTDHNGIVWSMDHLGTVAYWSGAAWVSIGTPGAGSILWNAVSVDRQGNVWVGDQTGRLHRWSSHTGWMSVPWVHERAGMIRAIKTDGAGNVWVMTENGYVGVYNGYVWAINSTILSQSAATVAAREAEAIRPLATEAKNHAQEAATRVWDTAEGKSAATLAKEARNKANEALTEINNVKNTVNSIQASVGPQLHRAQGLNGATATTTSSFSVVVDASGATEFRARREGGVWTGWTSVNNPVSVPDLIAGANTIQAEVRNAAGATATGRMIAFRL